LGSYPICLIPDGVRGPWNRFHSDLELMEFSPKTGDSIVEESGADRQPDIGREIHVG